PTTLETLIAFHFQYFLVCRSTGATMSRHCSHVISSGPLIMAAALAASIFLQPSDILSAGDAYAADATAEIGQPFSLGVNQTAYIGSADVAVGFINVTEDSRCPSDVVCICEGEDFIQCDNVVV